MTERTLFLIDAHALIDVYEKKSDGGKIGAIMEKARRDGVTDLRFGIPLSSFLHALWKLDPNTPVKNVQDMMDSLDVLPLTCDWKNEAAVRDEIIAVANAVAGGKK